MPLQNPAPKGLEWFATTGVPALEAAIARNDVNGVLAAQANIVGALGPAQAQVGEDHPFLREVEQYYYAASAWINQRATAATPSGQGVTQIDPGPDADSFEDLLPGGASAVSALQTSAVMDILGNLTPDLVLENESVAAAVRRIYRSMYGFDVPASASALLSTYERVYVPRVGPTMPPTGGGDPNVVVDFGDESGGESGGGGGGGGGGDGSALGPVAAAGVGSGVGMLIAAGVILYIVTRKPKR